VLLIRVTVIVPSLAVLCVEQDALMSPNPRGKLEDLVVGCVCVLSCCWVVGSDDVAASDNIGVLNGTPGRQKGSTSGSLCRRQLSAWRSPICRMYNRRSPGSRSSG